MSYGFFNPFFFNLQSVIQQLQALIDQQEKNAGPELADPLVITGQFTRAQLAESISPGFNEFVGPLTISEEVVDVVADNGQLASNGVVIVEDEVFLDENSIGQSGALIDLFGNIQVVGLPPGLSDEDVRALIDSEIERTNGNGVADVEQIQVAFNELRNGDTTPIGIVEEGGVPNGPARANSTVEIEESQIEASINPEGVFSLPNDPDQPLLLDEEIADIFRGQLENNGVVTNNGFIIAEDDSLFRTFRKDGGAVEAGLFVDIEN